MGTKILNRNSRPAPGTDTALPERLRIVMFSIHSCPVGELGTKDTGGMNVYIRELACELAKQGHRIDIYTRIHDPKDSRIIELDQNVRLIHLRAGNNGHMSKLGIYHYLVDFTDALESFTRKEGLHYDMAHSHYWLSGRIGSWAQAGWRIPHILMFHTLGAVKNTTGVGEKEPELRIRIEKQLVNTCDRIIAATERERHELIQHYDALPKKISVVPCGVNRALFQPVDRPDARRRLGFDNDNKLVLYVGRFSPLKGIDRLLAAMKYLPKDEKYQLVIIGGDGQNTPELNKLQNLTRELGIGEMVSFAGRIEQEDLPCYYSAADVLVVPSYHESFGLVALESLACGTPVIATRVGAMENIIQGGKTGTVVRHNAPHLLAEAIRTLLSRPHAKAGSVDAIRASIAEFGWPRIAEAVTNEYGTVLKHHLESSSAKLNKPLFVPVGDSPHLKSL